MDILAWKLLVLFSLGVCLLYLRTIYSFFVECACNFLQYFTLYSAWCRDKRERLEKSRKGCHADDSPAKVSIVFSVPWTMRPLYFLSLGRCVPGPVLTLKPNSWTYNFVEVSGHNLESSQTWGFCVTCCTLQTSFKPFFLKRGLWIAKRETP
jgi:hypothetical protein